MTHSTVESEWDDAERAKMLAFAEYEANVGECGHYHGDTTDEGEFFFDMKTAKPCPVCAAKDRFERVLAKKDSEWVKQHSKRDEGPSADQPWPGDGRVTYVNRVPKEEALERIARAEEKRKARPSAGRSARRPRRASPAEGS